MYNSRPCSTCNTLIQFKKLRVLRLLTRVWFNIICKFNNFKKWLGNKEVLVAMEVGIDLTKLCILPTLIDFGFDVGIDD
jgi:hypothetical protein